MTVRAPHLAARLQGFGTTIFAEMSRLAVEHGAINLGQGFPDFDGPDDVREVAVAAIRDGRNQYAPGPGIPELRQAIADHQQRFWSLAFDPDHEVLVTAGATEAICASMLALLEPGDEVVVFEPWYDSYLASIAMAGGRPAVVPLDGPDFSYDSAALRAAVGPRTRAVLLNSPHNPTGKVWSHAELADVAALCVERDLLAITDEVYEHLVYDGTHQPLAAFPGMRDRTVTISSGGKTFSFTGWKIGWVCASEALVSAVRTAKQFMTFVNGTPFQYAIAHALGLDDDYFDAFTASYRARRDRLCDGLASVGFDVTVPAGTYFATADIRPLGFEDGDAFCRALPAAVGVAAVPHSAFHTDPARGAHLVRFAFCKTDAVLDEGIVRLARLPGRAALLGAAR